MTVGTAVGPRDVVSRGPCVHAQWPKASLTFSPAFFRSDFAWSLRPSFSVCRSPVTLPIASFALPAASSTAFLALSVALMVWFLSRSERTSRAYPAVPGDKRDRRRVSSGKFGTDRQTTPIGTPPRTYDRARHGQSNGQPVRRHRPRDRQRRHA